MSTETLLGLFPIVFILHDFEELIMGPSWIRKHGDEVARRFPFLAGTVKRLRKVSASGYAMMVLIMFILVSGVTLISELFGLFNLWAGAVVVFLIHFLLHIGQFVAFRGYVPVIVTSVPGAAWCLYTLNERALLDLPLVGLWTLAGMVITAVWLSAAHWLGARFDLWLRRRFPPAF